MNAQACFEEIVLPDTGNHEKLGIEPVPVSPGLFLLQGYSNETVQSCDPAHESSLSTEQQLFLANLNWDGEHNAKQRMLMHNLIVNIALQYPEGELTFPDLVRAGRRGFFHALEKFDAKSNLCFSSYATRCINQYIERAIATLINSPDYFRSKTTHTLSFDNPAHRR